MVLDQRSRLFWLALTLIGVGWALAFALETKYSAHQIWGSLAVVGYGLAALAAMTLPRRLVPASVTLISIVGAVLAPLTVLTVSGDAQSEVGVVERSAQLLVSNGAVYTPDPHQQLDYNPYLPGMAVFGLPHQLLDSRPATGARGTLLTVLGDARIWFALVFVGCLFASWSLLRRGSAGGERQRLGVLVPLALIGAPIVAIPLCVSGVDLPVIGLACLALACAASGRRVATGFVTALTCALKWTAWPLLPVVVAMVFMRRGLRQALWCTLLGIGWTSLSIMPFALHGGRAMLNQVAKFPLGLARVSTPAASPLPGHVLADLGQVGRIAALALLAASCGAVAAWTIHRPPRTAVQAVNRLAAGLTAVFVFAPSSRFGYFALPLILWLLPHLASGSVQLTIPLWRGGWSARRLVLTSTLPWPAHSAAKAD